MPRFPGAALLPCFCHRPVWPVMSGRASSAMTLPRLTPAGVAQRKSGALIRRWSAVQFSPPAPIDNPAVVQWPERLTVDQVTAVRLRPQGPILHGQQRRNLAKLKSPGSKTEIVGFKVLCPWTVARHETVRWETMGRTSAPGVGRIQSRSIFIQLRNLPDTKPDNKSACAPQES